MSSEQPFADPLGYGGKGRNPFVNQVFVVGVYEAAPKGAVAHDSRNPFVNQVFVVANKRKEEENETESQSLRKSGLCRRASKYGKDINHWDIAPSQSLRKSGLCRLMLLWRFAYLLVVLSQSLRKSGLCRHNPQPIGKNTKTVYRRNPFVNQVFVVKNFEAAMAEAVRTSQSLRKSGLCRRA